MAIESTASKVTLVENSEQKWHLVLSHHDHCWLIVIVMGNVVRKSEAMPGSAGWDVVFNIRVLQGKGLAICVLMLDILESLFYVESKSNLQYAFSVGTTMNIHVHKSGNMYFIWR